MKRLVSKARVLVADGARALILRNEGDAASPDLRLIRSMSQDNPPSHEQGTDRPGRSNDALGRRSAMEQTDWHRLAEDRFITKIAAEMAKDLAAGEFTQLVVAAPPVALGTYRKVQTAELAQATVCEIDKDLTKHRAADIAKLVTKALEAA